MAGSADTNGDEEKPLDPMVENVRRRMMRLMIISISIMMIGLMAVLGSIVYKFNTIDESAPQPVVNSKQENGGNKALMSAGSITLPEGAVIETSSLAGDRILLNAKFRDGSIHLLVFDMTKAKIIANFLVVEKN